MSTTSLVISPPAISVINKEALIKAYSVIFGSIPLSKRKDASVFNPCRFAVLRILTGLKYALSKKMLSVTSVTPLSIPPNTPAIHIGFSISQIIRSSSCSSRSRPSNVVNLVPFLTVLTTTLSPDILLLSKACKG